MLFLGIISWKGVSRLNGGGCFSVGGGFIFKWGGSPMGTSVLVGWGGGFEKNCKMGGSETL